MPIRIEGQGTPFVNIRTGKIYNVRKGSWMWWHEKGHLEYDKLESTGKLKLYQGYTLWGWIFFVTLTTLNKYYFFLSMPLALLYIGFDIYEEWWCNQYANSKAHKN